MKKQPSFFIQLFDRNELFVLISSSLFLIFIPGFNSLAYESCFALGIISVLTFSICGALRLRDLKRSRPVQFADTLALCISHQIELLFPLSIIVIGGASHTCRWDIGLAWFFLLPMVSGFFGSASALWANRISSSAPSTIIKALTPTLLFSLLTLRDLYVDPPLFFFHPSFGYFAGPIYDEWIPITSPVILFRVWTMLFALSLLSVGKPKPFGNNFLGMIVLLPLLFRPQLGWFFSAAEIETRLGATFSSKFVRLHYASKDISKEKANRILDDLSQRVRMIGSRMAMKAVEIPPIDVYLYSTAEEKRAWTGTRYTQIGNPWQRRVHLSEWDPRDNLLTHELAHVVVAPFGIRGFGLPPSTALLEGFATSMERYRSDLSLDEWAKAMSTYGQLPDVDKLLSKGGFFSQAPSRAYLATGAFLAWLEKNGGPEKIKKTYRDDNFQRHYGISLVTLVAQWKKSIDDTHLSARALELGQELLRDRPFFEKRCPHDVADAIENGKSCYRSERFDQAYAYFRQALAWDRSLFGAWLRKASIEAAKLDEQSLRETGDQILALTTSTSTTASWGHVVLGDAYYLNNKLDQAKDQYGRGIRDEADTPSELMAWLRLRQLQTNLDTRDLIRAGYFWTRDQWKKFLQLQDSDLVLKRSAQRLFAVHAEDNGDVRASITTYETLLQNPATEGERLFYLDQLERLRRN